MITFTEYQVEVARTAKHPDPSSDRLVRNALGLAGEAGEVVEMVKKARFHGKPYDVDAMCKELGDVLWYVTDMCAEHGLTLAEVAEANVAKLRARYPDGFVKGGGIGLGTNHPAGCSCTGCTICAGVR